jgi:hypothetical protein
MIVSGNEVILLHCGVHATAASAFLLARRVVGQQGCPYGLAGCGGASRDNATMAKGDWFFCNLD